MMFLYNQSTGSLSRDGEIVGQGYSGSGDCKNQPLRQDVPCHGPIPRGLYTIGDVYDSEAHGPFVMRLTPDQGNEMHGRGGFLIHGDSRRAPGTASQGCIIMPRSARVTVGNSGERRLEVIARTGSPRELPELHNT